MDGALRTDMPISDHVIRLPTPEEEEELARITDFARILKSNQLAVSIT